MTTVWLFSPLKLELDSINEERKKDGIDFNIYTPGEVKLGLDLLKKPTNKQKTPNKQTKNQNKQKSVESTVRRQQS